MEKKFRWRTENGNKGHLLCGGQRPSGGSVRGAVCSAPGHGLQLLCDSGGEGSGDGHRGCPLWGAVAGKSGGGTGRAQPGLSGGAAHGAGSLCQHSAFPTAPSRGHAGGQRQNLWDAGSVFPPSAGGKAAGGEGWGCAAPGGPRPALPLRSHGTLA